MPAGEGPDAERAIIAERLNALVNAVVMESRGVYMAATPAEVEKFGKPLEIHHRQVGVPDSRMVLRIFFKPRGKTLSVY